VLVAPVETNVCGHHVSRGSGPIRANQDHCNLTINAESGGFGPRSSPVTEPRSMIRLKRVYETPEPEDGVRILVGASGDAV
jgi:hypothetical protein